MTLVTPGADYVYEYAWSPDSTRLRARTRVATATTTGGSRSSRPCRLRGGALHDLLAPKFQINDPQWSPDGSKIAVVGGIMSDFGPVGGDVYVVDANDGNRSTRRRMRSLTLPICIGRRRTGSCSWPTCSARCICSTSIRATGDDDHARPATKNRCAVSRSPKMATIALVRTSFSRRPEFWAGAPEELHQVTTRQRRGPQTYGKAVSLTWKSDPLHRARLADLSAAIRSGEEVSDDR